MGKRKRKSEWKAIEEVASSRRDEFVRKLGYSGDVLGCALDLFSKVWDEFPEFRQETEEKSRGIVEVFSKRLEQSKGKGIEEEYYAGG